MGMLNVIGNSAILDSGTNNFGQVKITNPENPFSGNSEGAKMSIDGLGGIQVALGTSPQGQGHETVASEGVADEYGVSPDQVSVVMGFDSAVHPYSLESGEYASRRGVLGARAEPGA